MRGAEMAKAWRRELSHGSRGVSEVLSVDA
jgi:hypothetical protein